MITCFVAEFRRRQTCTHTSR